MASCVVLANGHSLLAVAALSIIIGHGLLVVVLHPSVHHLLVSCAGVLAWTHKMVS